MSQYGKIAKVAAIVGLLVVLVLSSAALAEGPKWIGAFFVKGKIGLKWQKFEGATEYRVYRKIGSGSFEKIQATDKTQHFDAQLTPGEVHVYKIAAIDASGSENFSVEKSVTVAGGSASRFMPPEWIGIREVRRGLMLNWVKVNGAIAYNIFRSTTPGGPYDVVGNATVTKYSDNDVEQGETYYYVLTAMNEEFEETDQNSEQSHKYGLTDEEKAALDTNRVELVDIKLTFLFALEEAGDLGTLNQPFGVDVNSKGDIYITDTRRFRIDCFDNAGKYKFSFGERTPRQMEDDPPEGTFVSPMPLCFDKQDRVYIGDNFNNNIQVFTPEGKFIRRILVEGGEGMKAFRPNGLAILDDGRIVSTDAGLHRLLFLDQDGKILFETRRGGADPADEKGLWFSFPCGLSVDNGVVSMVDQMGARIQQFDLDGKFIRSFGKGGYAAGEFGRPKCITAAEDGSLWVSDGMANTIQVFDAEGVIKSAITGFEHPDAALSTPAGLLVRDNRLYIVTRLAAKVLVFQIG